MRQGSAIAQREARREASHGRISSSYCNLDSCRGGDPPAANCSQQVFMGDEEKLSGGISPTVGKSM